MEHSQGQDEAAGAEVMDLVLENYTREQINEGALLALTVLLGYEAAALNVPLGERVEFLRGLIRGGFEFKLSHQGDDGA